MGFMDLVSMGLSFLGGFGVAAIGLYKFVASRITLDEARQIYRDAKKAIDDYRAAVANGSITPDDRLKIAEDAVATIEEIIKDLEQ